MPISLKNSKIVFALVAAAILVVCLLSVYWSSRGQRNSPNAEPLNPEAYLNNANGLRGNEYYFEATVENLLSWSPGQGRILSFKAENNGKSFALPVIIPSSLEEHNVQKGQRLHLQVRVIEHGFLQAVSIEKS